MEIEVFAPAWNEERSLEQFLDWYSFARAITIFDNHSTDNTREIALKRGCNVIPFGSHMLDVREIQRVKEECWKDSRADWVIVCDVDEFIYHPDLLDVLGNTEATVVRCVGFRMVSEDYQPWISVKEGVREALHMDKCICFRPNKIDSMNWSPGCHQCSPCGEVRYLEGEVKLLHFRLVGRDIIRSRYAQYSNRDKSEWDVIHGVADRYNQPGAGFDEMFDASLRERERVW